MSDTPTQEPTFASLVEAIPGPAGAGGITPVTPIPKGKPHMSKAQRAECTLAWRLGTMSAKQLAAKYGVTERAIYKYFRDRKIKHGELAEKQAQAAEKIAAVDPNLIAQRVAETNEHTFNLLRNIRILVGVELASAKKAGRAIGTCFPEFRALKEAAAAVRVCREETYAVLGVKEGDGAGEELPELRIRGLTQDEIDQLQQETQDELDGELLGAPGADGDIEELPSDDDPDITDDDD